MDDLVAAGRQAWARLGANQRAAWSDWKSVGLALQVGKDAALLASGAAKPYGKTYTRIFGGWLRENGFDSVSQQARYRLLKCMEHIDEIEAWRTTLDESARGKLGHPDSVWFAWRRATEKPGREYVRPYRPHNKPAAGCKATHAGYHRPIAFDQAMVKRAGDALRKAWCNDCYKLAAIALSAAIRNEIDLLELLPDAPKQKPAPRPVPRLVAPVPELELTA